MWNTAENGHACKVGRSDAATRAETCNENRYGLWVADSCENGIAEHDSGVHGSVLTRLR